jgi:hypothetical protein
MLLRAGNFEGEDVVGENLMRLKHAPPVRVAKRYLLNFGEGVITRCINRLEENNPPPSPSNAEEF